MSQKYLFKNTDYLKLTANIGTDSPLISSKYNNSLNTTILYNLCRSILAFFLLLSANYSQAQTKVIYTSTGKWICPVGVTSINVEAWGAGAGGRNGDDYKGTNDTKGFTGGGGGGGAYAKLINVTVIPGTSYDLTVGGTTAANTNGVASTALFGTRTITAAGGLTGAPPGLNALGGAGGTGSIGDLVYDGGNGGSSKGSSSGIGAGGGGGGGAGNSGPGLAGATPTNTTNGGAGGGTVIQYGGAGGKGGDDNNPGTAASTAGYGGGGGGAGFRTGNGFTWLGGTGQNGAIIITVNLTYGPGGVTPNLQLWLRSDLLDGTTTVADNSPVTTWKTQALGDNATKPAATGAPIYKNNPTANINFNSVVDFTNSYTTAATNYNDSDSNRQYLKGPTGFYSQDIFVVMIPDVTVTAALPRMAIFCGDQNSGTTEADATGIGYGDYVGRMTGEVLTYALGTSTGVGNGYGVADKTSASYNAAGIINTRNNNTTDGQELYFNAKNVVTPQTLSPFGNVSNSQYWIGRTESTDGSLDGRLAEVITYSSRTTDTERSNIRSYLALKYGITLGTNGTSMNYTNSAGSTIWDIAAPNSFSYDIAGIGRDDITKLTQRQSKSINTVDDITIGLGTIASTNTANTNNFDADKKFLVWGNNHGALTAQSVIVNISSGITTPAALVTDVSYQTINRTWKVVETGGDVSSCKISIPASMLATINTPAVTPGDYMMFISSTSTFDANAEARILTSNGSNLETTYNFDGTKYITFGYAPEKTFERCIKFDGTNDYLDSGNVLDLNTSFTVSAWVNCTEANKTILSKRNSAFTQGYDLSINSAGKAEMSWFVNGDKKTITSNSVIPLGIWHHIGVTFDGTTAKMFIDGVNKVSSNLAGIPTSTTNYFLIAAADGLPSTAFFKGSIDEVRVWDVALTDAQYRYVMNQEILSNGTLTNGAIIPNTITLNNISSIPWTNLKAYYPMSTYSFVNAKDKSSYGLTAALRNINTVDLQTAPLPYESAGTGNWETTGIWKNSNLQDLPNSVSIEEPIQPGLPPPGLTSLPQKIDWNIIKVKNSHTVTSIGNKKVLGLVVEPTANIIATVSPASQTDGTKIEVSHYLKLDGKIDLAGRSQLVQTEGSDLDITSAGSIERDQQGQANKYNYNYWGSPVGATNNTTNNNPFTVAGVLRDGTNPNSPIAINWVSGYNGAPGSPISLARYWIYKFDTAVNDYANWAQIFETGSLTAGKGFTLKGSGAATATQNLTFTGKPNNGTITNTVIANQLLLVGNPYSSALDADQFITDNTASLDVSTTDPTIDGALYFWEHYSTNNTHNLGGYQGGYGIYNKSGGVAPSSTGIDFISGTGTTSKLAPNRYIPVGQGFFVFGNVSGGNVVFKNSQRAFIKENDAGVSQTTYRIPVNPKMQDHWTYSGNDPVEKDSHKKIRLGYNSYNETFHRQVLLAFMDEKANSEMNDGYDAYNIDDSPSDMYLLNGENELAIEGEGYFDQHASYPIGVRLETAGKVSFGIDALENFDDTQNFFIYDKLDDSYHNIKAALYEVELPEGSNNERFALRFTDKTLGTDTFSLSKSDEAIVIVNQNVTVQSSKQLIKNILVYDLGGRKIDSYKKVNALKYTLSHLNKTTAGLIVKITLENDTVVTKKIIY